MLQHVAARRSCGRWWMLGQPVKLWRPSSRQIMLSRRLRRLVLFLWAAEEAVLKRREWRSWLAPAVASCRGRLCRHARRGGIHRAGGAGAVAGGPDAPQRPASPPPRPAGSAPPKPARRAWTLAPPMNIKAAYSRLMRMATDKGGTSGWPPTQRPGSSRITTSRSTTGEALAYLLQASRQRLRYSLGDGRRPCRRLNRERSGSDCQSAW